MTTAYTTYASTACHSGNVLAFETDNVRFFGGGSSRYAQPNAVDLVIDLNPGPLAGRAVSKPPKYVEMENVFGKDAVFEGLKTWATKQDLYWRAIPRINIDWKDFSDLNVLPHFFKSLYEEILTAGAAFQKENGIKMDVLVMCMGGHGRTGTMLCIFATMAGVVSGAALIEDFRKMYCKESVETFAQAVQISTIAGYKIDFASPPSKQAATYKLDSHYETPKSKGGKKKKAQRWDIEQKKFVDEDVSEDEDTKPQPKLPYLYD